MPAKKTPTTAPTPVAKPTKTAKADAAGKKTKGPTKEAVKELKEKQRQARPVPARLQAATDRCAKAQQLCEEHEAKVASICESLKAARRELEAAGEKRSAAMLELEEVKQAAGAEPVVEAEKILAGSVAVLVSQGLLLKFSACYNLFLNFHSG